jgi:cadmium resistance protein CadD (predicted permease)
MTFATAATAASLFAGTNIDDIVVLALLNCSSRVDGRPATWQIWLGQYIGVSVLVGVAMLAAMGLAAVPDARIWPLGLLPLGLGLHKLVGAVRAHRCGVQASPAVATGLGGVIAITVANGGDNVAAYVPLFRTGSADNIPVIVIMFAIGIALWCMVGSWLASRRGITRLVERWGVWIIPSVYIVIGLYIFYKAAALGP